jgi:oxalate decarboxylase/phosphoglucose isomerase-like protein (cupin superfamily)
MTSVIEIIQLPKIMDERGNLTFIEAEKHIPFQIKRVYMIYDVPGGEIRGSHAFKKADEFIVCLSGSFDLVLNDGKNEHTITLNRSYNGVYIPHGTWRTIRNFSTNSLCLVISSTDYSQEDYIRDFNTFKEFIKHERK